MAAMLRAKAISGWQMHRKDIPGTPDFYFQELHLALFIRWVLLAPVPKCSKMPTQNGTFWNEKLTKNVRRDKTNSTHAQSERHQCDPIVGARPGAPD